MKFETFAPFTQFFDTWQKMTVDSTTKAHAFFAEIEKAEAKRLERAESAIEEIAKLQKETINYGAQLAAEWRRASLEAFQKAASFSTTTTA